MRKGPAPGAAAPPECRAGARGFAPRAVSDARAVAPPPSRKAVESSESGPA